MGYFGWVGHYFGRVRLGGKIFWVSEGEWGWVHCLIMPIANAKSREFECSKRRASFQRAVSRPKIRSRGPILQFVIGRRLNDDEVIFLLQMNCLSYLCKLTKVLQCVEMSTRNLYMSKYVQ